MKKKANMEKKLINGDLFVEFLGDDKGAKITYKSPSTKDKILPSTYFKDYLSSSERKAELEKHQEKYALDDKGKLDPDSPFVKWLGGVKDLDQEVKDFLKGLKGGKGTISQIKGKLSGLFKKNKKVQKELEEIVTDGVEKAFRELRKDLKQPNEGTTESLIRTMLKDEGRRTLTMLKTPMGLFKNAQMKKEIDQVTKGKKEPEALIEAFEKGILKVSMKAKGDDLTEKEEKYIQELEENIELLKKYPKKLDQIKKMLDEKENETPPMFMTKEEILVGKKYTASYAQSTFLPMLLKVVGVSTKLAGSSKIGASIVSGIAAITGVSVSAPVLVGAVSTLTGLYLGGKLYNYATKKIAEKSKTTNPKVVAALEGYDTVQTINDEYIKDLEEIKDNKKKSDEWKKEKMEERRKQYEKDLEDHERGREIYGKRKASKKDQGFAKNSLAFLHEVGYEAAEEILEEMKKDPKKFVEELLKGADEISTSKDVAKKAKDLHKRLNDKKPLAFLDEK